MTFSEAKADLFTMPQGYCLAHCISADYALGAGIATSFNSYYNMRAKLRNMYPVKSTDTYVGKALKVDNVFNLVTKERCFMKPTYNDLTMALMDMKEQCVKSHITKVAMPKIGCGLDGLQWNLVEEIIVSVFSDTDIDVVICYID